MPNPHIQTLDGYEFPMILVEGGAFNMGSPPDGSYVYNDEKAQHQVQVSGFYIGKFPVTQALWKAVMNGENPSRFQGDERPVEQVSWDDDIIKHFLPALRRISGLQYRLPSEAEWEYAARGGKYHIEGYKYAGSDRLKDVGWFKDNSGSETRLVGQKQPNQLGIHDMSGNVWEWCEDDWHDNRMNGPKGSSTWINSPYRVTRGGSWSYAALHCSVTSRDYEPPGRRINYLGFRLALSLQEDGRPMPASL
jgi:formylglycine-generating enzyme required for sulfatase activity